MGQSSPPPPRHMQNDTCVYMQANFNVLALTDLFSSEKGVFLNLSNKHQASPSLTIQNNRFETVVCEAPQMLT